MEDFRQTSSIISSPVNRMKSSMSTKQEDEIKDFHKAYKHAQAAYEKILSECEVE